MTKAEMLRVERINADESDPCKRLLRRWNAAASDGGFTGSEYVDEPEFVFARVRQLQEQLRSYRIEVARLRRLLGEPTREEEEASTDGP